jgi:nucleoside-diphosphate-sugar epimerase
MRIFVTGATGFIGSAVVSELIGAGHQVTGLARSDQAAAALEKAGARARRGDLEDLDSLRAGAAASDGVIHTAFTNISATTSFPDAARADLLAVQAIGEALAGSGKPFAVTSGTGLLAAGRVGTEEDAPDPASHAAPRIPSEEATLALATRGVRSMVVRLSFSVHGDGDHGFVPDIIEMAKAKGVSGYPGDGANRWPAVHRVDAARLFRLAVESAPAGARLHGVADEGVPFGDIAAVIGRHLGLPVKSLAGDEVAGHFGWLAGFVAADAPASSELTRKLLGWQPTEPGLLADIDTGRYFGA